MTIKEIWESLTPARRSALQGLIMQDGVGATAAWRYLTGRTRPMKLYRESICRHVNYVTGETHYTEELFPEQDS